MSRPNVAQPPGEASVSTAAPIPATPATPRQMLAWAFFDWASSPFFAVVITFVFATYVTTVLAVSIPTALTPRRRTSQRAPSSPRPGKCSFGTACSPRSAVPR